MILMNDEYTQSKPLYKVVINHEGHYSFWPVDRVNPLGWADAGKVGTREDCLAEVAAIWTDMRPLSIRRQLARDDTRRSE
jgi:MbtH protein